jgi:hypothetical protein
MYSTSYRVGLSLHRKPVENDWKETREESDQAESLLRDVPSGFESVENLLVVISAGRLQVGNNG